MTDLTALLTAFFSSMGKEAGKQIITLLSGNEDRFKKVVEKAVAKLDRKYEPKLFGGNLPNRLLKPTVVEKLKKILLPFDPPTQADFEEDEIFFDNLPPEFFSNLKEELLKALIADSYFTDRIIAIFTATEVGNLTTDLKSVGGDVGDIKATVNAILVIQLLQFQRNQPQAEDSLLPAKPTAEFDKDLIHIPKVLYPVASDAKDHNNTAASLGEILAREKRVLMLSAAAMGKSIEMRFYASEQNASDDGTFVVKIPLNLFTGGTIEDLIAHQMPEWQRVPASRLVLMFDGLDEIHISYFNEAIRKLNSFARLQQYAETTILISCRDNFFVPDFTEHSFAVYKLKELDYPTSLNFIKARLGSKSDKFLSEITAKSLQGLFTSPFFLHYLVDLFANERGLPESKADLFEKVITYRLERDKKKFATKNIDITKKEQLIKKEMGRLALIMESLGRNVISESEFQDIVPDYDGKRMLLEHTFLFDHGQAGWQFEHNNFQEFLAAKEISRFPFDKIVKLITVDAEYPVVKPSWVNTISFLFQLAPLDSELFKQVLKWFIDHDRELLLRFERDRVDLATREEIVKAIMEYYQGRGLLTRSEKFDLKDLADFVSDSHSILEYLTSKISGSPTTLVLSECCSMLPRLRNVNSARKELQPILEGHALNTSLSNDTRYNAIFALGALHWQDEKFLELLIPTLDLQNSQYDRAGFYKYLSKSGFQDKYVQTVLDLVQYEKQIDVFVNSRRSRSDYNLGDESINRDEYFGSIDGLEEIKTVLEYCADCLDTAKADFFVRGILDMMFEKATRLFKEGRTEMLETILKISRPFSDQHRKEYDSYFVDFVDATETRTDASRALYNSATGDEQSLNALAMIIDKPFVDFLTGEFKAGRFSEKNVLALRGALNWRGPSEVSNYYYERINSVSGDAFLYPVYPDWKARNDLRNEKDRELIMDKELFMSEMRGIYQHVGKDEITQQQISELNRSAARDIEKPVSNICIKLLVQETIKPVPLERFERRLAKEDDWQWFQIRTLLEFDSQNVVELKKEQIDFIAYWVQEIFGKVKFENSFKNDAWFPSLAYLAYFVRRFDLPLSEEQYVRLLWVSSYYIPVQNVQPKRGEKREPMIEWIIQKIGIEKVESALRLNFAVGISASTVIRDYFETAQRHDLNSLLPLMTEELKKATLTSNDFHNCVAAFLAMNGDPRLVEYLIENDARLDAHDQFRLIDKLIDLKYSGISAILLRRLQTTTEEEEKLQTAERLLKVGSIDGLQYYKEWTLQHQTMPRGLTRETIKLLAPDPTLQLLFDILDILLGPAFDRDHLMNEDQDLLDAINFLGASSRERYDAAKLQYNSLYEKYGNKVLQYWLPRLDKDFYSTRAKEITLPDIIKTIDGLI